MLGNIILAGIVGTGIYMNTDVLVENKIITKEAKTTIEKFVEVKKKEIEEVYPKVKCMLFNKDCEEQKEEGES